MSETLIEYDDLLDSTDHRRRNRLIGLAVLGVLIAAGAYALWAIALGGGGSSSAEIQTATVELGSISQTLSTTGVAVAQSTADLAFEQAGTVSAVNVTLGQEVKQGDVLAEIEADDLQSALTAAEVNLASAQAQLDELLGGSTASDLASADQSLLQAQANLDDALSALEDMQDGASESELRGAEQAVAAAESQLAKAQESRESLYTNSEDAIATAEDAVAKAEDALANAEQSVESALDNIAMAKLSLLSAGGTYCDTEDHLAYICDNFTTPLSDTQISQLSSSIIDEITISSAAGDSIQVAQVDPIPTPQATSEPEPTATPEAEPTATPDTNNDDTQAQTDADIVQATTSLISANTSYKNAVASKADAGKAVESAEAELEAAKIDLEEAKEGPTAAEIVAADVDVSAAELALDEAKADLDELKAGPTQDDLDDAQNNLDAATAALAVAQAKWNDVYDGADSQDISLQREQVRQAEEAVEKAREDLEKAQLIAPFDGTVAELNVEVGDEVGAAAEAAIVLNTPNALRLQLTFTESDVLNVKAGQTGMATFDALENAVFPIEIESVGTNPTSTQGVVTYEAWARVLSAPTVAGGPGTLGSGSRTAILATAAELLGMTEDELQAALESGQTLVEIAEAQGMSAEDFQAALMQQARGAAGTEGGSSEPTATPTPSATPSAEGSESPDTAGTSATPLPGMNASVTIILDSAQNVLVVPESAVQTEGPNSVVEVQKDDGTTEKVVVQTGLSDGSNVEITEGLEEGQTVIIPTRAATTSATQTTGFPQGGFIISGEDRPDGGGGFAGPTFQSAP
ncbi:MAG TPA: biotin/lipoyl-binding protein [Dehalococcoidia bacterium]|nr:biotin/lipoyl-binding protein [Dehalococcoidia bacterium]